MGTGKKFGGKNRWAGFFMCDKELKPMTERALPAADGFAGASVISPAKLLVKLFKAILWNTNDKMPLLPEEQQDGEEGEEPGRERLKWSVIFGEEYAPMGDDELREAWMNLNDLVSDYTQLIGNDCGAER